MPDVNILIEKNRDGRTADDIYWMFDKNKMRFKQKSNF